MIEQLVQSEVVRKPRDARLTTILLIGCVSTDTQNDLCRVRDISAGGMRIETMAPIGIGQRVSVELKNGVKVSSEVVWVRNAEAGVRFAGPVNIEEVLAPTMPSQLTTGVRVTRSPRLSARCPVALRHNGHIVSATMTDISQGGARLQANGVSKVGDQLIVFVPALGSRRATVRWVRDNVVGVLFAEKIGFTDLAQWLAGTDRFGLGPAIDISRLH